MFHYYRHRMFRTGDSDYKVTAGLATGAALSFTPFLGTHIIQAMFFSWIIGGSMVAGLVGTFVGNPWTYPLMFLTAYEVGLRVCALWGVETFAVLPADIVIANADHEPWAFFLYMLEHPVKILLPLAIGGYICAIMSWPVFYALLYYPVRVARAAYVRKHSRKRGRKA